MFAKSTIAVFEGSRGRDYYSIHGLWVPGEKPVYYDIDFPLQLAMKLETPKNNTGFQNCLDCQFYGTYQNIAIVPCGNCLNQFPEYKCNCFNKGERPNFNDLKNWCCGTNCVWFASNAIYSTLDPTTISLSKVHNDKICQLQRGEIETKEEVNYTYVAMEEVEADDKEEAHKLEDKDSDDEDEDHNPDDEDSDDESDNDEYDLETNNLSAAEQSILNQFSEFCDRVMYGEP